MSQLIEIYTSILQAAGLTAKEDGSVFKKDERYFIKGKPLYLPLGSVLSRSDASEKIIFHPLAEAAAKGESDVLEELRHRLMLTQNIATSKLIAFFLQLGVGNNKISLDPEQLKIMPVVKQVGEKEVRDILDFIKATTRGEGKKTPLIKLYLSRRPTTVGNVKYHRTGIVTFPLYQAAKDELAGKEKGYELLGVKTNKKSLESFLRLMEFIYPGIDKDPEHYNAGSVSQIAPFADCMIRAVGGLASTFNEKVDLYKDVSEVEALRLPTSWIDVVDQMDDLFNEIRAIPLQPNADGKARLSDVQTAELSVRPATPQPAVTQSMQPEVHVTAAPSMATPHSTLHQQQQQQPAQAVEPEYISDANGVRLNPRYLRPVTAGGMPGMTSPYDPYSTHVVLPVGTTIAPPVNPYQAAFVPSHNPFQATSFTTPGAYGNPGGRLPGLSY